MAVLKRKIVEMFFSFRGPFFLLLLSSLTACSTVHELPTTPNLYNAQAPYPAGNIASTEQGTISKIYYVTDRSPINEGQTLTGYSKERSASMAFGEATIAYDEDMSWDRLVELSQMKSKRPEVEVNISRIEEIERFPATPLIFSATPNGIIVNPEEEAQYHHSVETLQKTVAERLKSSNQKDIILFVHGFNVSFKNAILGLNDVWHFGGRQAVPIAYSWPSGSGNLLGYFTDRESGEYTVYHFKETLRALYSMPEVEKIHILAHSRGTDISTTALRELVIEARASGKNPRKTLKVENLILAAPDLDYGVVSQRLIAEKFGPAFGQITIYTNENDSALGISQMLMKGIRFGKLTANKQNEREARIFQNVKNVSFINVKGVKGFIGHGYFAKHPGALSDIITLINTSSPPGTSDRPLTNIDGNFWTLDRKYLESTPFNSQLNSRPSVPAVSNPEQDSLKNEQF